MDLREALARFSLHLRYGRFGYFHGRICKEVDRRPRMFYDYTRGFRFRFFLHFLVTHRKLEA